MQVKLKCSECGIEFKAYANSMKEIRKLKKSTSNLCVRCGGVKINLKTALKVAKTLSVNVNDIFDTK